MLNFLLNLFLSSTRIFALRNNKKSCSKMLLSNEFETITKMSDSLFVVRKAPTANRHHAGSIANTSSSSIDNTSPSSTPTKSLSSPTRDRQTSFVVRRIFSAEKSNRDGLVGRILQYKARVARAAHVGTSAMLTPMSELSRLDKDCGGLTPPALCAAALALLPVANAFSAEQQAPSKRSVDVLIPVAGDDSRPFGFVEWNMMQAAAGMFGFDTAEITQGVAGWVSDLVLPWSEELLWRFLSSVCGALAVVHHSGLDYNGSISLEEIFCRRTTPVIPGRGVPPASTAPSPSSSLSPRGHPSDPSPSYQQPRHTKFVSKTAVADWSNVLPHQFQFTLCLPSKLMDPNPPQPVMTAEQVRIAQANDVKCVGELLSFVISELVDKSTRSTLSSELTFLIRRMCSEDAAPPGSPRPTALQLMQFQAVKLRVQGWVSRTGFEIERYLAEDREREYAHEIEVLKKNLAKMERHQKLSESNFQQLQSELTILRHQQQQQSSSSSPSNNASQLLEKRELLLKEREEKLSRFLSLYELTTSRLDAMSLTPDSCDMFKGLLGAASLNNSRSGNLLSHAAAPGSGGVASRESSHVSAAASSSAAAPGVHLDDGLFGAAQATSSSLHSPLSLSQTQPLRGGGNMVGVPSTPPKQQQQQRAGSSDASTPPLQMSPLPVIHSNNISMDEIPHARSVGSSGINASKQAHAAAAAAPVNSSKGSPEAGDPFHSGGDIVTIEMDVDDADTSAFHFNRSGTVPGVGSQRTGRDGRSSSIDDNNSNKADRRQRMRMDSQYEQLKKMQENLHREGRSGRTPVKEDPSYQHHVSSRGKRSPSNTGKIDSSEVDEAAQLLRQLRSGVRIS